MNFYRKSEIPENLQQFFEPAELGQESTPELYVEHMVDVFREIRRVLRDDGTVWLNLGDSYSQGGGNQVLQTKNASHGLEGMRAKTPHMASKQLMGIPWRVAFALQADGWWLRSDIIWNKPSCMPESVTDRPTKSHEHVFLLTKSARYFYDAEAIKEPIAGSSRARIQQKSFHTQKGGDKDYGKTGINPGRSARKSLENFAANSNGLRNKRTVWTIPTKSYSGAHFAVFPPALVEPMILAGTSEKGCCPVCGASWVRVVERKEGDSISWKQAGNATAKHGERINQGLSSNKSGFNKGSKADYYANAARNITTGWRPTCNHYPRFSEWVKTPRRKKGESDSSLNDRTLFAQDKQRELVEFWKDADTVPCVVLDPFAGSGTVGEVCKKLGIDCILNELNPEYHELIGKRLDKLAKL